MKGIEGGTVPVPIGLPPPEVLTLLGYITEKLGWPAGQLSTRLQKLVEAQDLSQVAVSWGVSEQWLTQVLVWCRISLPAGAPAVESLFSVAPTKAPVKAPTKPRAAKSRKKPKRPSGRKKPAVITAGPAPTGVGKPDAPPQPPVPPRPGKPAGQPAARGKSRPAQILAKCGGSIGKAVAVLDRRHVQLGSWKAVIAELKVDGLTETNLSVTLSGWRKSLRDASDPADPSSGSPPPNRPVSRAIIGAISGKPIALPKQLDVLPEGAKPRWLTPQLRPIEAEVPEQVETGLAIACELNGMSEPQLLAEIYDPSTVEKTAARLHMAPGLLMTLGQHYRDHPENVEATVTADTE